jgi:hypothetical protein
MQQKSNRVVKPNVIKGMWFRWEDSAPLSSTKRVINGRVGHKNPTYNMIAKAIWRESCDFILETPFYFLIRLDVIFERAKHGVKDKIEQIEIEAQEPYMLNDLNRSVKREVIAAMRANKSLPDGHKNKGIFKTVKFYVEIKKW